MDGGCRLGCGFANCRGIKTYICNYAVGWNSLTYYRQGPPCSGCPNTCSNNLCGEYGTCYVIHKPCRNFNETLLCLKCGAFATLWCFSNLKPHSDIYVLSDCKGVVCCNGGTLDYNTCTCRCTAMRLTPNGQPGEPLYTGRFCEIREWLNWVFP